MHLAKLERHAVPLHGIADLVLRVGERRPVGRAGLPVGRGLDRPLRVVVAERVAERLLDQVDAPNVIVEVWNRSSSDGRGIGSVELRVGTPRL